MSIADSMASRKNNPDHVVTSAAYLLFYRRRSEQILGGPKFAEIINQTSKPGEVMESQDYSRNQSPSTLTGEGQRLDDSSRIGLSSASQGVGAVHQAGVGGPGAGTSMELITDDEETELPDYSLRDPNTDAPYESMETDDIEGSGIANQGFSILSSAQGPTWPGFILSHTRRGSGDTVSTTNAASIDDDDRSQGPDWQGRYGNPGTPDGSIAELDAMPLIERENAPEIKIDRPVDARDDDDDEDGLVTEIKLSEGEESTGSKTE